MEHLRVALLHEQHLLRQGLARVVGDLQGYTVAAHVADPPAFKRAFALAPPPALVLLSLEWALAEQHAMLAWITQHMPHTRVLVVGLQPGCATLAALLFAGAHGFLCTRQATDRLSVVLDQLLHGALHYPAELLAHLRGLRPALSPAPPATGRRISTRHTEFLRWLLHPTEPTYKQIGEHMQVSERAVEKYAATLCKRHGVCKRSGLVKLALQAGLGPPEAEGPVAYKPDGPRPKRPKADKPNGL